MSILGPTVAQREALQNAALALHTFFLDTLEETAPDPLEQLAQEIESTTAIEEYDWVGDIPGLTEWIGDREEATIMAGSFQIKNKDFASGVRIHKNEILDNKMAQVKTRVQGLASEAKHCYGDLIAQFLINGFDGAENDVSDGTSYDGAFLFSDSHSSEGGPNQSNKLSVALSEAGLEAAEKKFGALRNHTGVRPLRVRPTHLIIGSDLESTADKLLGAENITSGVTNMYKGKYKKLVSPWLSGAYHNWWFLADLSKPLKPIILQKREAISSTALTDWSAEQMYRRGVQRFGAQARHNCGYGAWQSIVGSKVAA